MSQIKKWHAKIRFIKAEYPFGPLAMTFDEENKLNDRAGNPAYISPVRICYYLNGRKHGVEADIFGSINYYYRGVSVPNNFILDPKKLTFEEIFNNPNQEIRRVGCEIYGFNRMIEEQHLKQIHEDKERDAVLFQVSKDKDIKVVRVTDGTPDEKTGEREKYFLQVPPRTNTCLEGIAWTFYKEPSDYNPVVES